MLRALILTLGGHWTLKYSDMIDTVIDQSDIIVL